MLSDLTVEAFLVLRDAFFTASGSPKPFVLREKRNTQDDPLNEYVVNVLSGKLQGALCQKASGPLISPDLVIYRKEECEAVSRSTLRNDVSCIVAIEVKKLERSTSGEIARRSGLDYNTTPPCGTIRIYDADEQPLDVRGFYLFVCQESTEEGKRFLSALALCDGNILNEDFDLYLSIIGQREKTVDLGTYGDGANRNRPMLIFSNPLGASELDYSCTLVSGAELSSADSSVGLVYRISRTTARGEQRLFFAYRRRDDIPSDWQVKQLPNPFPQPSRRVLATQARGRFRIPLRFAR